VLGGDAAWHRHPGLAPLLSSPSWDDDLVRALDLPVTEVPLISVGGGLGSFALLDLLRILGVPASRLRALGPRSSPIALYRELAEASGIDSQTRIRSDSSSSIDNIWGWPGYAAREAFTEGRLRPLWQVLTEPLFSEPYTPQSGQVYRGVAREAARIGWADLLSHGWARLARKRREGGYFVLQEDQAGALSLWHAGHLHLAIGHPGIRISPALAAWRRAPADTLRFTHVYERHEHIYEGLRQHGGTVVVQGAGVAASQEVAILAALATRPCTPPIRIVRVVHPRTPEEDLPDGRFGVRQLTGSGFRYQDYSWPKAMFGGSLAARYARGDDEERAALARQLGRSSTPLRAEWQVPLVAGRHTGWLQSVRGEVSRLEEAPQGRVRIVVGGGEHEITADWLIDATGLDNQPGLSPLVADMLACGLASTNARGGLAVDDAFRVRGAESGDGRLYASGALVAGGPIAPVDSFWGLQRAALDIATSLAAAGWCDKLTAGRSIRGWWRWLGNRAP